MNSPTNLQNIRNIEKNIIGIIIISFDLVITLLCFFGSGYSRRNLKAMLNFYILYKNWETVFPTLSWGHYFSLVNIKDNDERKFYELECTIGNNTMLFH